MPQLAVVPLRTTTLRLDGRNAAMSVMPLPSNRNAARPAVFDFIEGFYNPWRHRPAWSAATDREASRHPVRSARFAAPQFATAPRLPILAATGEGGHVAIHYERVGSGTPLVLMHGIGHRWQAWSPVMDALAAKHEVVAIDLPGFGKSPFEEPYDVERAVVRLAAIFAELGLVRPHVAGNSLGGLLALELAAAGQVASATAISPAGFWNRRQRAYSLSVLTLIWGASQCPRPVVRACLQTPLRRRFACGLLFGKPSRAEPDVVMADLLAFRDGRGFWPAFRRGWQYSYAAGPIDVPVTIAWGTKDRILLQGQARRARRLIPEAEWVDLPGLGHVPMSDDPELVARTILTTAAAVEQVS